MEIYISDIAKKQLIYWKKNDKKTVQRIFKLIEDIKLNGFTEGIGKPEQLKYHKDSVRFSRRINKVDRLVYAPLNNGKDIEILSCRGHYED